MVLSMFSLSAVTKILFWFPQFLESLIELHAKVIWAFGSILIYMFRFREPKI